jgi:hypothetical protein
MCLCLSCSCDGAPPASENASKSSTTPYLALLFAAMITAVITKYAAFSIMESLYLYLYSAAECSSDLCWANNAVYRISLGLALFFFIAVLLSFKWKTPSIILAFPIVFAALCLPISWIEYYPQVSQYFALIFLVLQVLVFLDFAHRWNENWRDAGYTTGLLIVTALLYVLSIISWILLYKYFDVSDTAVAFISLTIVLSVGFTLLSVSSWSEFGSILPSSIVTLYCSFLLFTALYNLSSISVSSSIWLSVLSTILAAASILYASWNVSRQYNFFGVPHHVPTDLEMRANNRYNPSSQPQTHLQESFTRSSPSPAVVLPSSNSTNSESSSSSLQQNLNQNQTQTEFANLYLEENPRKCTYFYLILCLSSIYMGVMLCDWSTNLSDTFSSSSSSAGFWINMTTQWITISLYTWTLVAPKCCPNRDFST